MEIREQLRILVESGANAPYSLVGPDGSPFVLMDDSLVPFFLNPNPLPNNESLEELFAGAGSVKIREILNDRQLLIEETDLTAIQALAACLRVKSEQIGAHCMTPGVYLVEVEGSVAETFSIVTPTSIRWDERWHGDAELEDGLKLANWLAERGFPKLLNDFEEDQRAAVIYQEKYDQWESLMPCLESLWPEFDVAIRRGQQDRLIAPALERLSQKYETHREMLRALLAWYGSNGAAVQTGPTSMSSLSLTFCARSPSISTWRLFPGRKPPQMNGQAPSGHFTIACGPGVRTERRRAGSATSYLKRPARPPKRICFTP